MPYMTRLREGLIRFGLGPYLEEVPGWQTRGSSSFAPACTIGHHTAGPFSGDRPSLNICVNGRTDLPGPLCNDFLSRSKVILVAAGRANHAGIGGFRGLVGNSAAFGNEAESAGRRRPDGSPDWSEFQRWAFPRVHAAHLWLLGRDASWYCAHRDWTTRKIDPTGIDTAAMRREIAALLASPNSPGGFLMALSDAEQHELRDTMRFVADQLGGPGWRKGDWGWPDWRVANGIASDDVKLTLLDYLRSIDRQVNSGVGLAGRPGGDTDTELGHLLSLRAELRGMLARIEAIVVANRATLNVEVSPSDAGPAA